MTLDQMIDYWEGVRKCSKVNSCTLECKKCQFNYPSSVELFEQSEEVVDYLKELKNLRNTIKLLTRIKGE